MSWYEKHLYKSSFVVTCLKFNSVFSPSKFLFISKFCTHGHHKNLSLSMPPKKWIVSQLYRTSFHCDVKVKIIIRMEKEYILIFHTVRKTVWPIANIENKSKIFHIAVKRDGGQKMFGNEWCMMGSDAWLLLMYQECPSRLIYSQSAKRNHLRGCRRWS
jgi:hypothetical protein